MSTLPPIQVVHDGDLYKAVLNDTLNVAYVELYPDKKAVKPTIIMWSHSNPALPQQVVESVLAQMPTVLYDLDDYD